MSAGGEAGAAALAASRAAAAGAAALADAGAALLGGVEAYAHIMHETVTLPLQARCSPWLPHLADMHAAQHLWAQLQP